MDFHDKLIFLKQLYEEKTNGKLDEDEELLSNQTIWRNRVAYDEIEKYIQSSSEQIKLETLRLLVQSKKTTLRFIPKELDLILVFIRHNLGESIDYVPLIKKAFKRLKESLAVFQRNVLQPKKLEAHKNATGIDLNLYQQLEDNYNAIAIESLEMIKIYRKFISSVREECLNGLCCGATHIRKKNSLLILQLEREILFNKLEESQWDEKQVHKLFNCLLLDTYESNKEIAFKILNGMESSLLKLQDPCVVYEIIDVALQLANSARPIDSITALYMFKIVLMSPIIDDILKKWNTESIDDSVLQLIIVIITHLKNPTKLANENIIAAVAKHSLYGFVYCINGLISFYDFRKLRNHSAWSKTIAEIIIISLSLNTAISVVVNNSSPEGHFPMDFEKKFFGDDLNESDLANVTPQMVLLCSWRTVKEVSLLFGLLAIKCPIENETSEPGLISEKQIVDIGNHLVTLLIETKHRGAFEQAHVGFEKLCSCLWRLKQKKLQQLPKIWLHDLLLAITGISSGNSKLCATRRSAGVPFMVQAVIASEPSVKSKTGAAAFHCVMGILLKLVQFKDKTEFIPNAVELILQEAFFQDLNDEKHKDFLDSIINTSDLNNYVTLPEIKTHALNILRALFKHAQLGDLARAYAADGLIAAIINYNEKTWAERNAATLLFSALITRIFGVQRSKDYVNLSLHNKMTGRIFFEKYPKLLPFMLAELEIFKNESDASIRPSVQSILLLLSRLYIGVNFDNTMNSHWENNEFVKLVSACAKSRIFTTRELAARAVVPLLSENTVIPFINELFTKIQTESESPASSRWNIMHGYMLQAFEISKSNLLKNRDLFQVNLAQLINNSTWIIDNLSADNHKPACFPLAGAYIDLLTEFMNLYENKSELLPYGLYHQILVESMTYILNHKLKRLPGIEMFEISIVKFIIKWGSTVNNEYAFTYDQLLHIWIVILSHSNSEVQILGWTNLIDLSNNRRDLKKELLDYGVHQAVQNIQEPNRDLQSVIQEFLYQIFIDFDEKGDEFLSINTLKRIWDSILCSFFNNMPRASGNALKLLGKTFGLSFKYNFYEPMKQWIQNSSCKLYEIFFDNSWTSSTYDDCRLGVVRVIDDIYIDFSCLQVECSTPLLDWWTILLRLLVDDNFEIRTLACAVVHKLDPQCHKNSDNTPLAHFFYKFSRKFEEDKSVRFAAYFYWSLSLSGDDYQMDENDVFNKFYNYEVYEPLHISYYCEQFMNELMNEWDIDCDLPIPLQEWLSCKLDIELTNCTNPKTVIAYYKSRMPILKMNLYDLLDPTYNDKLLESLIFNKLTVFAKKDCDESDKYN